MTEQNHRKVHIVIALDLNNTGSNVRQRVFARLGTLIGTTGHAHADDCRRALAEESLHGHKRFHQNVLLKTLVELGGMPEDNLYVVVCADGAEALKALQSSPAKVENRFLISGSRLPDYVENTIAFHKAMEPLVGASYVLTSKDHLDPKIMGGLKKTSHVGEMGEAIIASEIAGKLGLSARIAQKSAVPEAAAVLEL